MEKFLELLLSFLVSLAANAASNKSNKKIDSELLEFIKDSKSLSEILTTTRPLSEDMRAACIKLAQNHYSKGITQQEKYLWQLLSEETFQDQIYDWIRSGDVDESGETKSRIMNSMEEALKKGNANEEQITFLKNEYFDSINKIFIANPTLASWRHQLSLDYIRDKVNQIEALSSTLSGNYSDETKNTVLSRYQDLALKAFDIIDLSNLPEGDVHLVTQKLLLRQLFIPLKLELEQYGDNEHADKILKRIEKLRERRRREEADILSEKSRQADISSPLSKLVSDALKQYQRIVILGDPGGGKTTLLRWLATAYLLRSASIDGFKEIPDSENLPQLNYLPILIRCRDLGEADLCRSFDDFLHQHLMKSELLPNESVVLKAIILQRLSEGTILLLIDGLDEINDPKIRMLFCQELERTGKRYPDAKIITTSRVVGYRDMPYRMGSDFTHTIIANLDSEDKDDFAARWIDVTNQQSSTHEKEEKTKELCSALHSSSRIENLTGNPMLLTTLALVKRKVGKLPNKRTKLYSEAVSVLLNWNPAFYQIIEDDEGIPQLEYLAYSMCEKGVQRLNEDEVLDSLDQFRSEYPNVRATKKRSVTEFLELIEARSSILIKSGGSWSENTENQTPIWEFRHLTFQEYLASRALIDGRFPNRNRDVSLPEHVANLAGELQKKTKLENEEISEKYISESWRETLRLLAADAKDDEVDEIIRAILYPLKKEQAVDTARPRAVLAALCLSDEPNTSEDVAREVIVRLASLIRVSDSKSFSSLVIFAIQELSKSIWAELTQLTIVDEFFSRPQGEKSAVLELLTHAIDTTISESEDDAPHQIETLFNQLDLLKPEINRSKTILSVANMVQLLSEEYSEVNPYLCWQYSVKLFEYIMHILRDADDDLALALLTCLYPLRMLRPGHLLNEFYYTPELYQILPEVPADQVEYWTTRLNKTNTAQTELREILIKYISRYGSSVDLQVLLSQLENSTIEIKEAIASAVSDFGDSSAVEHLFDLTNNQSIDVSKSAWQGIRKIGDATLTSRILKSLNGISKNEKSEALKTLVRIDPDSFNGIFSSMISSGNQDDRRAALDSIKHIQYEPARQILEKMLYSVNGEIQFDIFCSLSEFKNGVDEHAIIKILNTRNREEIVEFLYLWDTDQKIGDKHASKLVDLIIEDEENGIDEDELIWTASECLRSSKIKKVKDFFERGLTSDNHDVYCGALIYFSENPDPTAEMLLIDKLSNLKPSDISLEIYSLGKIGGSKCCQSLISYYSNHKLPPHMMTTFLYSIANTGTADAFEFLSNELNNSKVHIQEKAISALASLNTFKGEAAERLVEKYKSIEKCNYRLRVAILLAFGKLEYTDSIDILIDALEESEFLVSIAAIWSLGNLADSSTLQNLIAILRGPKKELHESVFWAITQFEDEHARTVIESFKDDKRSYIRYLATNS